VIFIFLHTKRAKAKELNLKKRVDIDLEVHFAFAVDEGGLLVFAKGKPLVLHEAYTRLLRNRAAFNVSQLATATFGLLAESVIPVTKCLRCQQFQWPFVKKFENQALGGT
jgi:hypothetical protein